MYVKFVYVLGNDKSQKSILVMHRYVVLSLEPHCSTLLNLWF